jgi:predicted metal-dependent peptidase
MRDAEALDLGKLLAARYRAARAQPYLAGALHAMTVVSSSGVRTMGVDRYWRCYANPAFVAATPIEELAMVWLHEVAHLLRQHHARARTLFEQGRADAAAGRPSLIDPRHPEGEQLRLNLAMDCEINDDLKASLDPAGAIRLPADAVTAELLRLPKSTLFEQYLPYLSVNFDSGRLAWSDCGSGAHDGCTPWELGDAGANPLSAAQADTVRFRVAEQIRRSQGSVPAGWKRWAEDLTQPSQDWRRLLQAGIRHSMARVSGAADYAYRRPGRRAAALGGAVVMPSLVKPVPAIAVVIDTSGSVADTELGIALGETAGIITTAGKGGNRVNVYSCDAAVQTVQGIAAIQEISLVGGGGTDLREGIRRAQAGHPRPDIIVVLTDGHTPWPEMRPSARVIAGLFGPPPHLDEFGDWRPAPPPDWVHSVRLGP